MARADETVRPDGHLWRDHERQTSNELTCEQNDHSPDAGKNCAADQQPRKDVDVRLHVRLRPLLHLDWRRGLRNRRSAFAAELGVRLDFISTLRAKHVFTLSSRNVYLHSSELLKFGGRLDRNVRSWFVRGGSLMS